MNTSTRKWLLSAIDKYDQRTELHKPQQGMDGIYTSNGQVILRATCMEYDGETTQGDIEQHFMAFSQEEDYIDITPQPVTILDSQEQFFAEGLRYTADHIIQRKHYDKFVSEPMAFNVGHTNGVPSVQYWSPSRSVIIACLRDKSIQVIEGE